VFRHGSAEWIVSKLSKPEVRTTHVTGMITDMGIALGRMLASAAGDREAADACDGPKLALLSSLVGLFFTGGVMGALDSDRGPTLDRRSPAAALTSSAMAQTCAVPRAIGM
jgi:hypothetical protein